jgi:hypothetical protein
MLGSRLRIVCKMLDCAVDLQLSPEELRRTKQEVTRLARSILWRSSHHGVPAYLDACRAVCRAGSMLPLCNIKNVIRAIAAPLRAGTNAHHMRNSHEHL